MDILSADKPMEPRVVPFIRPVLGGACNTIRSLARGFKTRYERCEGRTLYGGESLKEAYILPRNACERSRKSSDFTNIKIM